ncbi:hypothetical protein L210DRAFT_3414882, partial [Boletus edulis BED1]
ALITLYSLPDQLLLHESSGTFISCTKMGEDYLLVINITTIKTVVAMIPHTLTLLSGAVESRYFLVEKSGMELARFGEEDIQPDNND